MSVKIIRNLVEIIEEKIQENLNELDFDRIIYEEVIDFIENDDLLNQFSEDEKLVKSIYEEVKNSIDYDSINDLIEDSNFINQYGEMAYCGVSQYDFI